MAKVPFKVSARAARLIGRENVATSQGAVTELVKNGYDADATVCAVLFLPRWASNPPSLSPREFALVARILPQATGLFEKVDDRWIEREETREANRAALNAAYSGILDLWIVDNGHGMSAKTIEDHWMVIGTDAKEMNDRSTGGRVVTGAKGIGRFALDRLGQECEMLSVVPESGDMAHWLVDWTEFEGAGKIISDVEAVLETEQGSLAEFRAFVAVHEDSEGDITAILDFGDHWLGEKTGLSQDELHALRSAWKLVRAHRLRHGRYGQVE